MFEKRKNFLNIAYLLIRDENDRIVEFCTHLVGVGDKIRRNVTAIELHAFHNVEFGGHLLALFDGDDAVFADFFHCVGNELTYLFVACGNRSDLCDCGFVFNVLADLF